MFAIAFFQLVIRYAYTVDELMVEYRVYPAMPWLGLLMALGVILFWEKWAASWPRLKLAILGSLACFCVILSAARSWTWADEDRLVRDVIRQYPGNLRAWSIHLSHLAERGEYERLAELRNLPQHIAMSLISGRGEERSGRRFTGEKTYKNYVACQYPLIKALVQIGEVDEALRRSDILLVDVLSKSPTKNHKSVFTVLLAKLLCHAARGEQAVIDRTIADMMPHYDDEWKLRESLAIEASRLPIRLAVERQLEFPGNDN